MPNRESKTKQYRPKKFDELKGPASSVGERLRRKIEHGKLPQAILLSGPSGCGKTTMARIVARELGCARTEYRELDVADLRGIDEIRTISRQTEFRPMVGKAKVFVLDEAHRLTKDAQNAALKMLEEPPEYVYFILCTTEPEKLIGTVSNRLSHYRIGAFSGHEVRGLVSWILQCEQRELTDAVVDAIVDAAGGSARRVVKILEEVLEETEEEAQIDRIVGADHEEDAIEIARMLLKGSTWKALAKTIKAVEGPVDSFESIRRLVLAYMTSVALGGGQKAEHAVAIIEYFRDSWADCGRAGLVAACFECCSR